jgi:hypothetical protein
MLFKKNDKFGVEVGVVTFVVNNGGKPPAPKLTTVPVPPPLCMICHVPLELAPAPTQV